MGVEKRLILALILSFLAVHLYIYSVASYKMKHQRPPQEEGKKEAPENVPKPVEPAVKPNGDQNLQPAEKTPQPHEATPAPTDSGVAEAEEIIDVQTKKYWMRWTNRGAALVSLKLKEYAHSEANRRESDWQDKPENWLELIPSFSSQVSSLSLRDAKGDFAILWKGQTLALETANWKVVQKPNESSRELIFELGPINGVLVKKQFTFTDENHAFVGRIVLVNQTDQTQERQLLLGGAAGIVTEHDPLDWSSASYFIEAQGLYRNKDKEGFHELLPYGKITIESEEAKEAKRQGRPVVWLAQASQRWKEPMVWSGLNNKYFAALVEMHKPEFVEEVQTWAFLPSSSWMKDQLELLQHQRRSVSPKQFLSSPPAQVMLFTKTKPILLKPGDSWEGDFTFWGWTKADLARQDVKRFGYLGDYGFFSSISRFLLWILRTFHGLMEKIHVPASQIYGLAIICLTLVVKLCLYPVTRRQIISMNTYQKKMSKFKPLLEKLQQKYKSDPKRLNQEVMNLYKQEGINPIPLGGCLPIFLQIPIFIGLYNALLYSLDLRQASFLWVSDLSQPDRLFLMGFVFPFLGDYFNLLPIVMTIIWVLQQKLQPKAEDPQMRQQQVMMMYMTIFFGFLFYNVAAGLVLYWLVMNLFSIIEQSLIKKQMAKMTV